MAGNLDWRWDNFFPGSSLCFQPNMGLHMKPLNCATMLEETDVWLAVKRSRQTIKFALSRHGQRRPMNASARALPLCGRRRVSPTLGVSADPTSCTLPPQHACVKSRNQSRRGGEHPIFASASPLLKYGDQADRTTHHRLSRGFLAPVLTAGVPALAFALLSFAVLLMWLWANAGLPRPSRKDSISSLTYFPLPGGGVPMMSQSFLN